MQSIRQILVTTVAASALVVRRALITTVAASATPLEVLGAVHAARGNGA